MHISLCNYRILIIYRLLKKYVWQNRFILKHTYQELKYYSYQKKSQEWCLSQNTIHDKKLSYARNESKYIRTRMRKSMKMVKNYNEQEGTQ